MGAENLDPTDIQSSDHPGIAVAIPAVLSWPHWNTAL